MTHSTFKVTLIIILAMILPSSMLAQQLTPDQHQTIWGAASNGICAGVYIKQSDWSTHKDDFYCNMEVGNMSTNFLWVWLPPLEQRYEIELRGPDGRRIRQLKPLFLATKIPCVGLRPLAKNGSLDWFFLKDTFDVRTNGLYTLIASVRVNVFTNFAIGHSQMRTEPVYFLLPPVTNAFNIFSPEPQGVSPQH